MEMVQIENHINVVLPTFDLSSSAVTLDKIHKEGILCAQVNGKWLRAKPVSYTLDFKGFLLIVCIDIGCKQLVPLSLLRLLPKDANFLQNSPPVASMFVLADVLFSNDSHNQYQPAIKYFFVI